MSIKERGYQVSSIRYQISNKGQVPKDAEKLFAV